MFEDILDIPKSIQFVLLVVLVYIFYQIAKAEQNEYYDPNPEYAQVPSYEPPFPYGSWAYYSPYRFGGMYPYGPSGQYGLYGPLFPYEFY